MMYGDVVDLEIEDFVRLSEMVDFVFSVYLQLSALGVGKRIDHTGVSTIDFIESSFSNVEHSRTFNCWAFFDNLRV